jgi:hypothetical protein
MIRSGVTNTSLNSCAILMASANKNSENMPKNAVNFYKMKKGLFKSQCRVDY